MGMIDVCLLNMLQKVATPFPLLASQLGIGAVTAVALAIVDVERA